MDITRKVSDKVERKILTPNIKGGNNKASAREYLRGLFGRLLKPKTAITPVDECLTPPEQQVNLTDILLCKEEYIKIDGIISELNLKINEESTPRLIDLLMAAELERYRLTETARNRQAEYNRAGLGRNMAGIR